MRRFLERVFYSMSPDFLTVLAVTAIVLLTMMLW